MTEQFRNIRDIIRVIKIDGEMGKVVDNGTQGREIDENWTDECWILAGSRRTGIIDASIYQKLSPAAKTLLPKELIIK